MNKNIRLQVLALPSQTTFLFSAIIVVVLAAVAASGLPSSPLHAAPPLAVILSILILRDFLMQPDREIQAHDLRPLPAGMYPNLAMTTDKISSDVRCVPVPLLMISHKRRGALFAFGSFRRHYIGIGAKLADQVDKDLLSPMATIRDAAEAALVHEFQHVAQGDVIVVGLARSTLKVSAVFMLWSAAFFLGLATVSFAYPAADIFSPAFVGRLTEINSQLASYFVQLFTPDVVERVKQAPSWGLASLFVLNAHLPIFYTATILSITVWRRLLRIREIYADAGTATMQGKSTGLKSALLRFGVAASLQPDSVSNRATLKALSVKVVDIANGWWSRTNNWLGFHPSLAFRRQGLDNPVSVLSELQAIGITAGAIVLLLDLMLISPFTLAYVAETPGLIAALAGFAAISLGLLPLLAADSGNAGRYLQAILTSTGWVLLIRMGFHFLNLALLWAGVFVAPRDTAVLLDSYALGVVGYLQGGAQIVSVGDLLNMAFGATAFAVYLTILIAVTLPVALLVDLQLKRWTLTWYGLPDSWRWIVRVWWMVSAGVAAAVGGIWLPIVSSINPLSAGFGFSIIDVVVVLVSLALLILVGVWWLRLHRRYGHRCPQCGELVPGWFYLGKRCDGCGQALHEWLEAGY